MLRLNTAIAPTPEATQNRLGLLGGLLGPAPQDLAGYPNGRRPNDDVVDISLIAVMGGLCVANGNADTYKFGAACKPSAAPLGAAVFGLHDGVDQAGPKVKANGPLLPPSRTSARRCRARSEEGAMKKTLLVSLVAASVLGACGGGDDADRRRRRPRRCRRARASRSTASSPTCRLLVASVADMLEPVDTSAVVPPADDTGEPTKVD